MSAHLKHLVQLIEDLKFRHIEERLANWLLRQCSPPETGEGPVVNLTMNKGILANQLGVTHETLSRTLAKFRHRGLLEVQGRRFILTDLAGIQKIVSGLKGFPP
jgi:CRP/FNR family transcriptional regulator